MNNARIFRLILLTASTLIASVVCQHGCWAHELEDGEVNRTAEIIIRDDVLFLRYALGANDTTLADLYKQVTGKEVPKDPVTLRAEFERQIGQQIDQDFQINWGEQRLSNRKMSVRQTDKHHQRFVFEAEFELKPLEKFAELKCVDSVFSAYPGAVRYALRPRGRAIVSSSNVAPVVARAKPVELGPLSDKRRLAARTIKAKVKISAKK